MILLKEIPVTKFKFHNVNIEIIKKNLIFEKLYALRIRKLTW